ncbi:VAMP-associated protein [Mycena vulgaris]|nr:VAMP-associated protein [Mycena vulgaris]
MSVSLSPSNSLGFNRPLITLVKRPLTITNHNAQPVAFKVKTTAPTLYCVRPNSGRLDPGQSLDVSVMLQPLKFDPPLNAKCKDKFLVQSTLITPGKEAMPLQDIWTSSVADDVHQQKLKVVYLPAAGQTLVEEDEEEEGPGQTNMSSMMSARDSRYDTARQLPPANGETHSVSAPRPSTPPGDFSVAHEESHHSSFDTPDVIVTPPKASMQISEQEPEHMPASALVPVPAPAPPVTRTVTRTVSTPAVPPAPLPPADAHAAKYVEAQAEIERLRALLATSQPFTELRRRTRERSPEVGSAVDAAGLKETIISEGVPLQVVVIIALGVFLTTYLFF